MIIVTGMHRSGTSLVAMTMEALGIDFGDHQTFYAADQWNARGYFERRDVMDINSRMITGFSRTQSKAASVLGQIRYLTQPGLESIVSRGQRFGEGITRIGGSIGAGAIKDPRLCLTWSVWAEYIDIGACVVCIRHPYDVADSLRRRQRIPMDLGARFWNYHVRALQQRTPPRMTVVDLETLIADPGSELGVLIDALGLQIDLNEAVRRFHDRYSPGLTKTSPPVERPRLRGETAALWAWLKDLRTSAPTNKTE